MMDQEKRVNNSLHQQTNIPIHDGKGKSPKQKRNTNSPKNNNGKSSPQRQSMNCKDVSNAVDPEKEIILGTFYNMVNAGCDPLRYRTALCEFVSVSKCQYKNCFFHHIDEHLSKRTVSENAKEATQLVMYLLGQRIGLKKQVLDNSLDELNMPSNEPNEKESTLIKEYHLIREEFLQVQAQNKRLSMENQLLRQLVSGTTVQHPIANMQCNQHFQNENGNDVHTEGSSMGYSTSNQDEVYQNTKESVILTQLNSEKQFYYDSSPTLESKVALEASIYPDKWSPVQQAAPWVWSG